MEEKNNPVYRLVTLGEEQIEYSAEDFLYQLREMIDNDGAEYTLSFLDEIVVIDKI